MLLQWCLRFKCHGALLQLRVAFSVAVPCLSIVGSVVECSPATRAARVRFPDDAQILLFSSDFDCQPGAAFKKQPLCKVAIC